jgi:hypothetical protein
MPHITQAQFNQMKAHLASGPILIGEDHTQPYGREAIVQLLVAKAVSFLSIEGPVVPQNMARADGQIQPGLLAQYCNNFDEMRNPHYTLARIARLAVDRRVPVYFHDMPHQLSRMRQLDPTYIAYARNFGGNFPRFADGLGSKLAERNAFTAKFLIAQLGKGVRVLQGLVILAGDHHLLAAQSGGVPNTIQAKLNIPDTRVYHLS